MSDTISPSWLILSEVFPLKIRAAAVSVGTLANFGSNVLVLIPYPHAPRLVLTRLKVTLAFESERQSLGETLLFLQFAAIAIAAVAFEFKLVPETRWTTCCRPVHAYADMERRGLTLEQIEEKIRGD